MASNKSIAFEDGRIHCQYGLGCYRRNPNHFAQFQHPDGHSFAKQMSKRAHSPEIITVASGDGDKSSNDVDSGPSTSKKQRATTDGKNDDQAKKSDNEGFGFYLASVRGLKPEWNEPTMVKDIQGILSTDSDDLVSSVQFNYLIDIPWLITKYPPTARRRPLLIVTSSRDSRDFHVLREAIPKLNADQGTTITMVQAQLPIAYGTHHTKLMILKYGAGVRIVVHTGNLIPEDWDQKTEGIYMTPLLKKMDDTSDESVDENGFKKGLIEYLSAYKLSALDSVVKELATYDMSSVKVKLVASVPGRFQGAEMNKWGHGKLRALLRNSISGNAVQSSWSAVAQFSSIGSLGPNPEQWLLQEFRASLTAVRGQDSAKKPPLHLIFPTVENVRTSLEGYDAGGSLPYSVENARKQTYLKQFFHQWRSECRGRSRASPHIKTYFRISPCLKKLGWFLLSSANLSKAAWGAYEKNGTQLMIRSYELGVLFLPEAYGKEYFDVMQADESFETAARLLHFPVPYDLPLVPYSSNDEPWVANISYKDKRDSHGKFWR